MNGSTPKKPTRKGDIRKKFAGSVDTAAPAPSTTSPAKRSPTPSAANASMKREVTERMLQALEVLIEEGQDRLTVSQVLFFLEVARRRLLGQTAYLADIRASLGARTGKTLVNTYTRLLTPDDYSRKHGMGWLEDHFEPNDKRYKPLTLTARGEELLDGIVAAFLRPEEDDR